MDNLARIMRSFLASGITLTMFIHDKMQNTFILQNKSFNIGLVQWIHINCNVLGVVCLLRINFIKRQTQNEGEADHILGFWVSVSWCIFGFRFGFFLGFGFGFSVFSVSVLFGSLKEFEEI